MKALLVGAELEESMRFRYLPAALAARGDDIVPFNHAKFFLPRPEDAPCRLQTLRSGCDRPLRPCRNTKSRRVWTT
jgi:hypothetical protein